MVQVGRRRLTMLARRPACATAVLLAAPWHLGASVVAIRSQWHRDGGLPELERERESRRCRH